MLVVHSGGLNLRVSDVGQFLGTRGKSGLGDTGNGRYDVDCFPRTANGVVLGIATRACKSSTDQRVRYVYVTSKRFITTLT